MAWSVTFSLSKLIHMLSAHFDESGTDSSNANLVVAGFVGTVEQWERFDNEWLNTLNEAGMDYFHAKQLDDGRRGFGPYAKWREADRRRLLSRLLAIIATRTRYSFATVLSKAAYSAVISPDELLRKYFGTPYSFAAFNCLHQTIDWRDQKYPNTPVLFTFDGGHKNHGELTRSAEQLRNSDRLIVDLTTGDDRRIPGIQAADLLAFEMCADMRRELNNPRRYTRYPLQKLDDQPHEWLRLSEDTLKTVIAALRRNGTLPPV